MKKLIFPAILLLLFCVIGCSHSGDQLLGPDTSDQVESDHTAAKDPVPDDPPNDPEGDPDTYGDGYGGPQ